MDGSTREDQILGGSKALPAILKMSIGPFFSQVTISMYGFINTLWLSKVATQLDTTALSAANSIDTITLSFGFFLMTCASAKFASLFGERRGEESGRILSDLIRLSFFFGIILPAILISISRPLIRWFGATEDIVDLGYEYIVPLVSGSVVTCFYLLLCGVLQAEGRIMLFSLVQISSLILNGAVFNPLFLLGMKTGIRGCSMSIIFSQLVPGIFLFISLLRDKFTVRFHWGNLIASIHPETWNTLKIGLPSLFGAVSAMLPGVIFMKYIGESCSSVIEFNTVMSVYNLFARMYHVLVSIFMALTSGFLPCGSYAFAAKRFKRVGCLVLHTTWINVLIGCLFLVIIFAAPSKFAAFFDSSELFVEIFNACLFQNWITSPIIPCQFVVTALLQATNHTSMAFIVSFTTQIVFYPLWATIFFFTDRNNVVRLFWASLTNDVATTIFSLPFAIYVINKHGIGKNIESEDKPAPVDIKDIEEL